MDLAQAFCKPSSLHIFGCDAYGEDLFRRILMGAKISLLTGCVVCLLSTALGLCIGVGLGYLHSPHIKKSKLIFFVISFLQKLIDTMLSFPGLLLAIFLASILPPSTGTVIFTLSVTDWARPARLFEALTKKTSVLSHIDNAIALGLSHFKIITRHILPLFSGQVLIQMLSTFGYAILGEAALSYLGLGGRIDYPSWGRLIAEGREYFVEAPHMSLFPGIVLIATLFFFNSLSNKLSRSSNYAYNFLYRDKK